MCKYKNNRYKRIVAQLLLSAFLFENCTQMEISHVTKNRLPGKKEKVKKEIAASKLENGNSKEIQKINLVDEAFIKNYPNALAIQYDDKFNQKDKASVTVIDLASLTPTEGFSTQGGVPGDNLAFSVSYAGDVNADGINDIIVGARGYNNSAGASYVIYGRKGGYPWPIDLSCLNANLGFTIQGVNQGDEAGGAVSYAGDVNADGISDVIIGARGYNNSAGASYVVYGQKGGYPGPFYLDNSFNGFIIQGASSRDEAGGTVSYAGDVNADGISDVIIGAANANNTAGVSYIIYGHQVGAYEPINLGNLNYTTQGFAIQGAEKRDFSGSSVKHAGDVNADGISDVIIGAEGLSYVIYGQKGGYPGPVNLASLNSTQGFVIQAAETNDGFGGSVSYAGDINVDGIDDVIVGAYQANDLAGASYVIYGQKGGYTNPIDVANLTSTQGFIIQGAKRGDSSGFSVSYAGDVNGDGISDVIVGASTSHSNIGTSYVIYGQQGGYSTPVNLANLVSTQGIIIQGADYGDYSGSAVNYAGDINADGISDVIIGAYGANHTAGISYIIYGKNNFTTSSFNVKTPILHQASKLKKADISYFNLATKEGNRVTTKDINRIKETALNTEVSKVTIIDDSQDVIDTLSHKERKQDSNLKSLKSSVPASTSDGSSAYQIPWYSPVRILNVLGSYFQKPQIIIDTIEAEGLIALQYQCGRMIQEADGKTADRWYRFSLEDLEEEITSVLKHPEGITEGTVNEFRVRLEGIEKDFLRVPLLKKPSFFTGIQSQIEGSVLGINNENVLLQPVVMPMLGVGYIPSAIGK